MKKKKKRIEERSRLEHQALEERTKSRTIK